MTKLSFALPKYDAALNQLLRNIQGGLSEQDALLGKIQRHSVSHGGITRQVSEPQILDTEMHDSRAMFENKHRRLLVDRRQAVYRGDS